MKKILAIDDIPLNLELISAILTHDFPDYQVLLSESGIEGIEIAKREFPDTILLDVLMPEMDGYEATRLIRKFNSEVVIIAQTAFALSGDREKSIAAGCNDYISKPIKKDELLSLIQKYFKK